MPKKTVPTPQKKQNYGSKLSNQPELNHHSPMKN